MCTKEEVSDDSVRKLKKKNINVMFVERMNVPQWIIEVNREYKHPQWSNTFEKLSVFGLTDFDKIVFLDADMLILQNIDNLFELPHMSAVSAGKMFPGNEHWVTLNSGLMVIEPSLGLAERIMKTLDTWDRTLPVGDQDLIHEYYKDWPQQEKLHLSEEYNCFYSYMHYYLANKILSQIKVVHFIGIKKPWMLSTKETVIRSCLLLKNRNFDTFKVLVQYKITQLLAR
ncbi:MAG: hypothetical protein LIO93_07440 [Bacteroidales bacterium]|nr:hypothetical protein [Bacteroidales bacterium]MCC8152762.1 hypothetical protein [Tannerellaceae bacterium]